MAEARPDVPRFAVADLFSGAGGLSEGFRAAGFELAFALDKDEDSCVTYADNFRLPPEHASITDFEPSDLAGKLANVDVILGGPSCQTFSTQGRRFKWADPDDERTKLWTHMLALVDEVRPRAFLLENVPVPQPLEVSHDLALCATVLLVRKPLVRETRRTDARDTKEVRPRVRGGSGPDRV